MKNIDMLIKEVGIALSNGMEFHIEAGENCNQACCDMLADAAKVVLNLRKENNCLRSALKAIRDGETMFDYASPNKIAELALNEREDA